MRITVIEHEAGAGLGFFAGWLAAAGAECEVARPYLGEAVPERAADGLIVLGGEAAAWEDEDYPWLPATRDLLRRSVDGGVPTLGICLGAQLMTLACGGSVERGGDGLEVGVRRIVPLPAADGDPLFDGLLDGPQPVVAVQYHGDAMTRLPEGAVPLATGDAYPNQAYRLGERAWAVQFHPEATPEIFTGWVDGSAGHLAALGHSPAELVAGGEAAGPRLAAVWRPFAERFAAVVSTSTSTSASSTSASSTSAASSAVASSSATAAAAIAAPETASTPGTVPAPVAAVPVPVPVPVTEG
ncbi:type 1 glutamine amidotransferase [Planobispora longispora]|uniref:Aminotransferase n=1 Tax=Planobispora longispora TaxID=28887 RepID=A0A8J3WAT4_9ACTN|nr:type 1 glutamine amidotransferase [Planobispora longispora]GIH81136.1 aminotransferase [Planobispora longispora]